MPISQINWNSQESSLLVNPKMPANDQMIAEKIFKKYSDLQRHVWISTSGSSSLKWVALSKDALLLSANSVNSHLKSDANDVWINPLPFFHVGGLGIIARCYLSGCKMFVYNDKWDAEFFVNFVNARHGTLTALVPTQVYDIVKLKLRAPASLRAIVVGGGALHEHLYIEARKLGWRLLPSFGMTECCSQVATACIEHEELNYPKLNILDHCEVKPNHEQVLSIKSNSLLTGFVNAADTDILFVDPKKDGWYQTEDLGCVVEKQLTCYGRQGNFVKIGGESVDVSRLESIMDQCKMKLAFNEDLAIMAFPDDRLGHIIKLVCTNESALIEQLVAFYNAEVMPFERIRSIHTLPHIPRTVLNKLCRTTILKHFS